MIKLPPWAFMFFRKVPSNYHGQIIMQFDHGALTKFKKCDEVDEPIFRTRHRECDDELKELETKQGALNGN